jgi:hypothetical protein
LKQALPYSHSIGRFIHVNNDYVRSTINKHLDFSIASRLKQAETMHYISSIIEDGNAVPIADFICPLKESRKIFQPDVVVFVNRNAPTRFLDTARIFEPPTPEEAEELGYTLYIVDENNWHEQVQKIASLI